MARVFGEPFGAGDWAYLAGLWHDLGKYAADFQSYIGAKSPESADGHIETRPGRVNHSSAGAIQAMKALEGAAGLPLAFVIAGHHAGLANLQDGLKPRLQLDGPRLEAAKRGRADLAWPEGLARLELPAWLSKGSREEQKRSGEFWIRFLFSALVDADFLGTEAFYDREKGQARSSAVSLGELKARLDEHVERLSAGAGPSIVNEARRRILSDCRTAASQDPGCFSLTAPTGSGKTLSAMAFSLDHAVRFGLRRVIVVLPFTSIIEQSAKVYREVFGDETVVEHHSNLDPETEDHRNRLASENWDAPIVVTTTVQFFESLFARRTSACRKLHNVARSVVILDEAQALPVGLLHPILDGLRELATNYGTTVVISTATQPAFGTRQKFPGLPAIREVVASPSTEFEALRRVDLEWPEDVSAARSWADLAEDLSGHPSFLAIVHKRADARDLASQLGGDVIHLSASMCAAHRLEVIARIKAELKAGRPVRVVSTQLVEAGVDIDFPVVYRAIAGLDALAQSAGRCNREGRLQAGRFVVFVPPTEPPRGVLQKGRDITLELLAQEGRALDPLHPAPFEKYYRTLYMVGDLDRKRIQPDRGEFKFETVATNFQMIEEGAATPIVVPFGDAEKRLDRLRKQGPRRETMRALQPFVVAVYARDLARLRDAGASEQVGGTVLALSWPYRHLYSSTFGLVVPDKVVADPAALIVG